MKRVIKILYLYPNEMNIYGDIGNVLALRRRLEWRGFETKVIYHHPGKSFNYDADIIVGGGGQDSGQLKVCKDLGRIGDKLHKLADNGVPMLMVCGTYQLFGSKFITDKGDELKGISIFNAETRGTPNRIIGNIVIKTKFGDVIGYENHSGQTFLGNEQKSFGRVLKGAGNNGHDGDEGAVYKNVYGTYLHGSLLPKNPLFTDHLLTVAVVNRYGNTNLKSLNEDITEKCRRIAASRPR